MNESRIDTGVISPIPRERRWCFLTINEWAVVAMVLVFLTAMLLSTPAWQRHRHTCAVCRLERTDVTSPLGQLTSTFRETSCSRWYAKHVEATHEHLWAANPTMQSIDSYGVVRGAGDNENRPGRVIWRLTPDAQIEIYKHFPKPLEAKQLFVSLTTPTVMRERHDFQILETLREWSDTGFAGRWEDRQPEK
ncbi:hypothetical protein [Symmachiella dynata]|uniref:hypothetical protein n=1 Tax=Symmachiella dynata TaxID=2527995 RepID=UPI0030EBE563|tara:strand:+ start:106 stop:681 length:576 start_codon:yes stop_codon:yes gene_type:complete